LATAFPHRASTFSLARLAKADNVGDPMRQAGALASLRTLALRLEPAALIAGLLLAACQPTQGVTPRPEGIPLAQLPEGDRGDPICGPDFRWDGTRCLHTEPKVGSSPTTALAGGGSSRTPSFTNLQVVDLNVGTGQEVHTGDLVSVHYTGALADGTVFDSSRPRGKPLQFRVGAKQVIPGFERGVVGMKVGGIRRLTIPPDLGYGNKGVPPVIPPKATLTFEVELVSIDTE